MSRRVPCATEFASSNATSPIARRSRRRCEEIEAEWGAPHLLVNNAGLDSPPDAPAEEVGPFETYPEASFDAVLDVNVKGAFLCCQVIGGAMARAGRGSIVNVSSIYGLLSPVQDLYAFRRERGETFVKPVAYSVSKSAVLNLTRYLATYWAQSGVRVNTLTLAGVSNDQPREFLEAYSARVPWAGCSAPTRRSVPSSSSPPTRRRTSPARTSSSTGAGRPGDRGDMQRGSDPGHGSNGHLRVRRMRASSSTGVGRYSRRR